MFYELGKRLFKITKNLINLIRVSLVFFTFFMVAYWIFEIAGATFIESLTPFFNSIKDFIHIFYNRTTVVDTVQLDYSFLVFAIFLLIVTWLLKFVVEFIEDTENKYDAIYKRFKNKAQELFNLNLERSYLQMENKNKHYAVFVKFATKDMAVDKFYEHETNEGKEEKQKSVLYDFLICASKNLNFQKRTAEDGVILFFHDVKNIDKILLNFYNCVEELKVKYKEEKWAVDYFAGIETYSDEQEAIGKCKNLKMLIKLNLKNELLCLSTFKQRYSLLQDQRFFIEAKGVYNIVTEEEVFSIKDKSTQKKLI